jgi:DNA-directed RNA polymerase specialized sigma24 family protein
MSVARSGPQIWTQASGFKLTTLKPWSLEMLFFPPAAFKRRSLHAEIAWPDRSSLQMVLGMVSPLTSPSEALARREQQELMGKRIHVTLEHLKSEDREVLCMWFFDQLSAEEIGQVLDIPKGTARQRYSRARLRFRETWKKLIGQEGLEP